MLPLKLLRHLQGQGDPGRAQRSVSDEGGRLSLRQRQQERQRRSPLELRHRVRVGASRPRCACALSSPLPLRASSSLFPPITQHSFSSDCTPPISTTTYSLLSLASRTFAFCPGAAVCPGCFCVASVACTNSQLNALPCRPVRERECTERTKVCRSRNRRREGRRLGVSRGAARAGFRCTRLRPQKGCGGVNRLRNSLPRGEGTPRPRVAIQDEAPAADVPSFPAPAAFAAPPDLEERRYDSRSQLKSVNRYAMYYHEWLFRKVNRLLNSGDR
jgi:hypothetical protein